MPPEVACPCGQLLPASDAANGSIVTCPCGRTVTVPVETRVTDNPLSLPTFLTPAAATPVVDLPADALGPTPVAVAGVRVMAALTADVLWLQDAWRLRAVPLRAVTAAETAAKGRELTLHLTAEAGGEPLTLTFDAADDGNHWCLEVQAALARPAAEPAALGRRPEGVALLGRGVEVPHEVVGRVEAEGASVWAADRRLQLQAGVAGADAVVGVARGKAGDLSGGRHATGVAVRIPEPADRDRVRQRWYAEEAGALCGRLLALVIAQASLLFVAMVFCTGMARLNGASGETTAQAVASNGLGAGILNAWPLLLLVLLWAFRTPPLVRAAGLAVLAVTTGRVLTVWAGHLLACATAPGGPPGGVFLLMFLDPVDWAFLILGIRLCRRAWRLAGDAGQMLPAAARPPKKAWAVGLVAATAVYAVAVLGWVGVGRYEMSAHVMQPGVDAVREQQALVAMNEGFGHLTRNDLAAAEPAFQRAAGVWQGLTRGPSSPPLYRRNYVVTLVRLAWILRDHHRRPDEAEKLFAQAAALGEELAGDPLMDAEFRDDVKYAREALAALRGDREVAALDEKVRQASRTYEDAQVKAEKGEADAERLFKEVIAVWEAALPRATNEAFVKETTAELAAAYHRVASLQPAGNRAAAEEYLKKAVALGEKAVALDPTRALVRHNLDLARRALEGTQERAVQEEVARLQEAGRYAAAARRAAEAVEELEAEARAGKDREGVARRLAVRAERLAWLLAHCPDANVRDTKAAVRHARRAAELRPDLGQCWYTLAVAQYRNKEWKASLESLDQVKAKEGGFVAADWFLAAMNRHQLLQAKEARAALAKGVDWMEEQRRKGEADAAVRVRFELARPEYEALRQEAEALLERKTPDT